MRTIKFLSAAIVGVAGLLNIAVAQERSRPNIVFIFSDDHAFQAISAYNGPLAKLAPTPNIDRIAKDGMLF